MSTLFLSADVFNHVFTSNGSSVAKLVIATAADMGPFQLSARYTSLSSRSIEMTVNTLISSLS